jgi:hypothetical protein
MVEEIHSGFGSLYEPDSSRESGSPCLVCPHILDKRGYERIFLEKEEKRAR